MEMQEVLKMDLEALQELAEELGLDGTQDLAPHELQLAVMRQLAGRQELVAEGVLEIMPDGYGFLRGKSCLPSRNDVYVSPSQIKRFNLKVGDV
ncbi:MAG TPA: transcription termination factor Rho, partial [Candidatus Acetothermia bacterium]|nr:transcription termination factor Rho [Candidatus Acetothermia bacterium]